jgi:predicted DNA-binding antitoxin AbrB/MazE fold protein
VRKVRETAMEIVTAVYEKGMLRPLRPLNLRERQRVRIQVLPDELAEAENEGEAAIRMLVAEGSLTPPPGRSDVPPISEQERVELADRLGSAPGKPLSEMIIEDRGEW